MREDAYRFAALRTCDELNHPRPRPCRACYAQALVIIDDAVNTGALTWRIQDEKEQTNASA
jgi:hypothetical protein